MDGCSGILIGVRQSLGRRAFKCAVALVFFPVSISQARSPTLDASAETARESCLSQLKNSSAWTPDGKVRVVFHPNDVEYMRGVASDITLSLEPLHLTNDVHFCPPQLSPSGAVQVGSLSVQLPTAGLSNLKGAQPTGRFGVAITAVRANWLINRKSNGITSRIWTHHGKQFGLDRYQRGRNLGAEYVGVSRGGYFVSITCVDFDITKNKTCILHNQVRDTVELSLLIPTDDIERWEAYSAIAEEFFISHLQARGG